MHFEWLWTRWKLCSTTRFTRHLKTPTQICIPSPGAIFSAEASSCRRKAGEREKRKRAGSMGRGKRRKAPPPHPPPRTCYFLIIVTFIGIPSRSLCGGERCRGYNSDLPAVPNHLELSISFPGHSPTRSSGPGTSQSFHFPSFQSWCRKASSSRAINCCQELLCNPKNL